MTFAHPWILIFLIIPMLLLSWEWRRPGKRIVLPFDHASMKKGRFWGMLINSAQSLVPLLLAVAVLLAAGPQQLSDPKSKKVMTNIQFCVDVSGSMTAQFGDGDRYDAAMASINEFIDYREGDSFGFTVDRRYNRHSICPAFFWTAPIAAMVWRRNSDWYGTAGMYQGNGRKRGGRPYDHFAV